MKTCAGIPLSFSACVNENKMLVFVVGFTSFLTLVLASTESCYHQRCLGCHPEELTWTGTVKECHLSNWVSAEWVHNLGHPPPTTDSRVPIEYRCLKLVATPDDKSFGNTVDVIRGCVPRAQVDSVCLGLIAVERARGHSDARCSICWGNYCNSTTRIQAILTLYFVGAIVVLLNSVLR